MNALERERDPRDVGDLEVIPRWYLGYSGGGYGWGEGACKANASTDAFFALFTTKALRVTGVEQ